MFALFLFVLWLCVGQFFLFLSGVPIFCSEEVDVSSHMSEDHAVLEA